MATQPYSFSDRVEPSVTKARRRRVSLSDERGRVAAWDSEAPATAHDHEVEYKESRTPLYIAGAVAAAIIGGLLVVAGAAIGEPRLYPTAVTETIPRQAALGEKLDAQALAYARVAAVGGAVTPATTPSAPVEVEATDTGTTSVEASDTGAMSSEATSSGATNIDPNSGAMSSGAMSAEPGSTEPQSQARTPENEPSGPSLTPAPKPGAASAIELDTDNPYTSERERPVDTPVAPAPPVGSTDVSDNPY